MPVMIKTRRLLTRNGKRKALKILGTLKNVKFFLREHVFKHIIFLIGCSKPILYRAKDFGEDMFKLFHETLGGQNMFEKYLDCGLELSRF